ncbi:MAG: adenylosuccinate synthase [Planctomycetota bacterium]|jgi:adenylosuccinate synthase
MTINAVIGLQWGDEGKAKIVDIMSKDVDYVVRSQGGANAGHTVVVGDRKYIFHLVPTGVLQPDTACVIGNGVVFDPETFFEEIEALHSEKIRTEGRVFVSNRCHIVMPYHKALDVGAEDKGEGAAIGTTKRGIGPTYADKARRRYSIRLADLMEKNGFEDKLGKAVEDNNRVAPIYGWKSEFNYDEILETCLRFREMLQSYVTDTVPLLRDAISSGKNILLEGAQGIMLDVDFGTYPYVTSSNTVIGGAMTGTGISLRKIDRIVGLAKAYTTRVGGGPFPTELESEMGKHLREKGGEYGSTTGRPRRCGWIDFVALKYAIHLADIDEIALTKLDVLSGLETVKACVAYEINGKRTTEFPALADNTAAVTPVYKDMPGWTEDLSSMKKAGDLPKAAKEYITFLEESLSKPIRFVSVGPERDAIIECRPGKG